MNEQFIVMRHPVLMEDEGHHEFIKCYDKEEDALEWVKKQKGEYFSPGDYYVATVKK